MYARVKIVQKRSLKMMKIVRRQFVKADYFCQCYKTMIPV